MGPPRSDKTVVEPARGATAAHRKPRRVAALLLAHPGPSSGVAAVDRIAVRTRCTVGRGEHAEFRVNDPRVSQEHFRVERQGQSYFIEDLGSTNGTVLDTRVVEPGARHEIADSSLIRAGQCLWVFRTDAAALLEPAVYDNPANLGLAGRFHVPPLLRQLMEAALSVRAPLLAGPSGVGKEVAASVLASLWGLASPRRYNVASAATPEELSRVLFGVAAKAFTGVGDQQGLIVTAAREGRPLFLDEVHNLPAEAQATLLTVLEDGKFSRKGAESEEVHTNTRFVFASNEPGKLKHDLRARLWRVEVPSLRERIADVPALFAELLSRQLERRNLERATVGAALDTDFMAALCLEARQGKSFEESNVRGLQDLADRIASRMATGASAEDAVDGIWAERLAGTEHDDGEEGGHYERHRELITAVYVGTGKNARKTVELLRDAGLPWTISRRHLTNHVERWGLK